MRVRMPRAGFFLVSHTVLPACPELASALKPVQTSKDTTATSRVSLWTSQVFFYKRRKS